jgi:hypothetical protein
MLENVLVGDIEGSNDNGACRELALRLVVEEENSPLVWCVLELSRALGTVNDKETQAVHEASHLAAMQLTRLLIAWVRGSPAAVTKLMGSPVCLYVFDNISSSTEQQPQSPLRGLVAMLALCLVGEGGQVARGLIDQRFGFERTTKMCRTLVETTTAVSELTWENEALGCVDQALIALMEQVILDANKVYVHGIARNNNNNNNQTDSELVTRLEVLERENHELREALQVDVRALQREHAELLLVLANQELDRQNLLQHLHELGGQAAVDQALERSARSLASIMS